MNTTKLTHHVVKEYPTAGGPAHNALFVDGRLLSIIEAKRVNMGPQNMLEKANGRYFLESGIFGKESVRIILKSLRRLGQSIKPS
jgi:hypothetical protein